MSKILPGVLASSGAIPAGQSGKVYLMRRRKVEVFAAITQGATDTLNQKQTITYGSASASGFIRLGYNQEWTDSLFIGAGATAWQTALEGLYQIRAGQVLVTKPTATTYVIEWTGTFANKFKELIQIENATYSTSKLNGYWLTGQVIYAGFAIGSTWQDSSLITPSNKVITLLPKTHHPSGSFELYVNDLSSPSSPQHVISIPYNATASAIQTLLNSDSYIGPGGCLVQSDGSIYDGDQVQIDMVNSAYFARISYGTGNYIFVPCGRNVQVAYDDDSRNWIFTGISWTY